MNVLITGSHGQLGNEMQLIAAAHATADGDTYFFTDVDELDITDEAAIDAFVVAHAVDAIVNCAAYTNVNGAESNAVLCDRLNHLAPGNLARVAQRRGCRLVHVSTDYVFDGTAHLPYREDDAPCPDSVYGRTKLDGERLIAEECPSAVIVRTAWLYSTFGNNFVKTMLTLGKTRPELGVVFDQIGTPTYARDLAAAIHAILHAAEWAPGIFHYTNEGVCSWYDFTLAIHALGGVAGCHVRPLHTDEYPTPARRPAYSVLDKTKIKETYHVAVPHWYDSLKECIEQLAAAQE